MQGTFTSFLETPIGQLTILADDNFVYEVSFDDLNENDVAKKSDSLEGKRQCSNELTTIAAAQLKEYFFGTRSQFTFAIKQNGTPFQQEVWQRLLDIPYAETTSYAKFSSYKPLAIRAIASANGKNNLAVVVPCHRVIGSNGKLVGYAGGLWRKQWLLQHERNTARKGQSELDF